MATNTTETRIKMPTIGFKYNLKHRFFFDVDLIISFLKLKHINILLLLLRNSNE